MPLGDWLWLQDLTATLRAIETFLSSAPPDQRAHLLFQQALLYEEAGELEKALRTLRDLAADPVTPAELRPFILFAQGRVLAGMGRFQEAVEAYRTYVALADAALKPEAYLLMARDLRALGADEAALAAYERAVALAPRQEGWRFELAEYLEALGRDAEAARVYTQLLEEGSTPAIRARAAWALGALRWRQGERDAAVATWRETLEIATATQGGKQPARVQSAAIPYAYRALVALLDAGEPVDDYTRGVIDVVAGAYEPAITVLIRYLDGVEPHHGDAHMYLARALERVGNERGAEEQWWVLVQTHPECACWEAGWFELASFYLRQGREAQALQVLEQAAQHPRLSPQSRDQAWLRAANLLWVRGEALKALAIYRRLVLAATDPNVRYRAALSAAVLSVERGSPDALDLVRHALATRPAPVWADPLQYWEGKLLLTAGQVEEAKAVWRELATRQPNSYYAYRAAEQLAGLGEDGVGWRTPRVVPFTSTRMTIPYMALREVIETHALPQDVAQRLMRAASYATVGLHREADVLFREALQELGDLDALVALGETFLALGWPHLAIAAGSRVLSVQGIGVDAAAPAVLRLLYPTPARDVVARIAAEYGVDVWLLYAIMRQESHFVPWATSSAQAQGVMQLIPSTARYVAERLGLAVQEGEIYRPAVNIRLGTFYFADALARFGGETAFALAAYNAGPANVTRWLRAWGNDVDVFVERIPYLETRTYVREVLRQAAVYRALYGRSSP